MWRNSRFFKYIDQPRMSKGLVKKNHEMRRPDNWEETVLRKAKIGKPTTRSDEPNRRQEPEQIQTVQRRSQRIRQKPYHYSGFIYYD